LKPLKSIIYLPSGKEKLEAQIAKGNNKTDLGIVLCHPHPVYGGTMANNVISTIFHNYANLGFSVIRFNFRGVGKSSGIFENGIGEQEDVMSVCKFLKQEICHLKRILIIGYSFGAAIGSSIAKNFESIIGYVAISYPFTFIPNFITLAHIKKKKLFIIGNKDDFTSLHDFNLEFDKFPEPKFKKVFSGIDHFWQGNEHMLINCIDKWIENQLL